MNETLLLAVNEYKRAYDARKRAKLEFISARDALQSALTDCGVSVKDLVSLEDATD